MTKRLDDCRDLPGVVCFNRRKVAQLRERMPEAPEIEERTRIHKALGHPGRLAAFSLLTLDECCVCDVAHVLRMPVSTASQHLHALKRAGLAGSRREGKLVFYFVASERARAFALPSLELTS